MILADINNQINHELVLDRCEDVVVVVVTVEEFPEGVPKYLKRSSKLKSAKLKFLMSRGVGVKLELSILVYGMIEGVAATFGNDIVWVDDDTGIDAGERVFVAEK